MIFREATINDVPHLNKLVNGAYRGESSKKGWTTEADFLDGVRTNEASLQKMISHPAAVILIAENNGEMQGCVYLEQQEHVLYLGMLTVLPELQAKGIGKQLLQKAEERAAAFGCNKIKITVLTVRDALIKWYERKGFSLTGDKEPFPDDPKFGIPKQPLEFIVMQKEM